MPANHGPGLIQTAADAEPRPLTQAEAGQVFAAMAAKGDEIAFGYVRAGCESRAHLMIEQMAVMGIAPGRATILSAGKSLAIPDPLNRGRFLTWNNHIAPFVVAEGPPHEPLVIDPSLSKSGPMTVPDWAAVMKARQLHVSEVPLTFAEMGELQTAAGLRGQPIDSFVFLLGRGQAAVPDVGGSGFWVDPDPPNGVEAFAREQMQRFLKFQAELRPGQPWPK